MTDFEYGFMKRCLERGLTEKQAGALSYMEKRGFPITATLLALGALGLGSYFQGAGGSTAAGNVANARTNAENEFFRNNPNINRQDYLNWRNKRDQGLGGTSIGRWWNRLWAPNDQTFQDQYEDYERELQQEYLNRQGSAMNRQLQAAQAGYQNRLMQQQIDFYNNRKPPEIKNPDTGSGNVAGSTSSSTVAPPPTAPANSFDFGANVSGGVGTSLGSKPS